MNQESARGRGLGFDPRATGKALGKAFRELEGNARDGVRSTFAKLGRQVQAKQSKRPVKARIPAFLSFKIFKAIAAVLLLLAGVTILGAQYHPVSKRCHALDQAQTGEALKLVEGMFQACKNRDRSAFLTAWASMPDKAQMERLREMLGPDGSSAFKLISASQHKEDSGWISLIGEFDGFGAVDVKLSQDGGNFKIKDVSAL